MRKISLKTTAHSIIALVLLVALATSLTGCGNNEEAKPEKTISSLVVCVQKTMNCPQYSGSFAANAIGQAQAGHGAFNVVVLDGSPFVAIDTVSLGSSNANKTNANEENAAELQTATALISGLAGETDECAIVESLMLADRLHAAAGGGGTTLICSTGLSTTGALDLTGEGMLGIDGETVAAYLSANGYALENTSEIVWYGFGDTAGKQESLTPAIKNSLKAMYQKALESLGVGTVTFKEDIVAPVEDAGSHRPACSTISIPSPAKITASKGIVKLDAATLPFIAGTATLVDETAARETLAPFVEAMNDNPSAIATVTGSTASYPWDEGYAYQLGLERAQTVANLLVEEGITEGRIITESYGDESPDHVSDLDAAGIQIPSLAQQNRWVSIAIG